MLAVVKVFKTSLVAVPALRRVEPASTSGPAAGDRGRAARDREPRPPVLTVHQRGDLARGHPIERAAPWIRALGAEPRVADSSRRHGRMLLLECDAFRRIGSRGARPSAAGA